MLFRPAQSGWLFGKERFTFRVFDTDIGIRFFRRVAALCSLDHGYKLLGGRCTIGSFFNSLAVSSTLTSLPLLVIRPSWVIFAGLSDSHEIATPNRPVSGSIRSCVTADRSPRSKAALASKSRCHLGLRFLLWTVNRGMLERNGTPLRGCDEDSLHAFDHHIRTMHCPAPLEDRQPQKSLGRIR